MNTHRITVKHKDRGRFIADLFNIGIRSYDVRRRHCIPTPTLYYTICVSDDEAIILKLKYAE